jgi:prevent-host-death family protein
MPMIRPSADLRNNYNEISTICHEYSEPVFITKNGTGDLAVMSMETYEEITGSLELYNLLNAGLEQANNGQLRPMKDALKEIRQKIR